MTHISIVRCLHIPDPIHCYVLCTIRPQEIPESEFSARKNLHFKLETNGVI